MTPEPVDASNRELAAQILAAAFASDPIFNWMARDRPRLDTRLRHGFRSMIAGELRRSEAIMSVVSPDPSNSGDGIGRNGGVGISGLGAVTIWHPIDGWKASTLEALRTLPAFAASFGIRLDRAIRVMDAMEKQHPTAPHYHLAYIGTHPAQQGKGLGSKLLAPMLERCDREGVPAYLESSNPKNEAFYVRHGFVTTGEVDLPKGAPPQTAMWREPRPPS